MDKFDVNDLPEEYQPLSAWSYFWLSIAYALPIIGTIILIIHALSNNNINRRNFARSYFCIIAIILVILFISILLGAFSKY